MQHRAAQDSPVADTAGPGLSARQLALLAEADAALGVIGRFRQVVACVPDAVAVSDEHGRLSFRDLAELAAAVLDGVRAAVARLGGPLTRSADGAPGGPDPVAVLVGHQVGAVAAMLGVVGSGHPLLVLDIRTPEARLGRLLEDAGVRVMVCDTATEEIAARLIEQVVLIGRDTPGVPVDRLWADPPRVDAVAVLGVASSPTRHALAAVDHRTLVLEAHGRAVVADAFRPGDRVAHPLPMMSFAGTLGVVAAALVGAEVCLYDVRTRGVDGFADWIQSEAPTVLCADSPLLRALLGTWPWAEQFAALRTVILEGEAAHAQEIEPFRALLPPSCVLRTWYGTVEGGLLREQLIHADDPTLVGVLPAGRAAYDREITVVDEQGRPVPDGETGAVTAICRMHLFSGYWLDPEATQQAATTHADGSRTYRTEDVGRLDADGVLHVIGRREDAVRIGEQLIHPAEIEAALLDLPEVREAVVVGASADHADQPQRLVAYVVPDADQPSAAKLRSALRGVLPGHLVPEAVVYLDALPRTEAGAIDHSQLPPAPSRPVISSEQAPLTSMEVLVAGIWAEVLELDRVGRTEDFFELGGDSLSAEALISRIVSDLGVDDQLCTTTLLIEAPTVAEFAARLRGRPAVHRGPLVPLHRAGRRPPLFIMAGAGGLGVAFVPWARLLGSEQPTWALQCSALEGRGLPERSVRSIARSNVSAIRAVQPRGPYYLAGYSFGGLVALETAHQLKAAGQQVGLLVVIDSFPPDPASLPPLPRRAPIQRLRDLAGISLMSVRSTPGGREHWRFQDHAARLARHYTCAPWDGRTLVLVGDSDRKDLRSRWSPHLTGTWRMARIPGDHLSITRLPWAATVADQLRIELDAALGAPDGTASRPV